MEEWKCVECGNLLPPGTRKDRLCGECAYRHVMESARQLKEKKGPYYEKWKAGVKAAAERL